MTEFLLFIDTEASALPKKWDEPYAKEGNWPHSVQIAWIIYTNDGNEVKRENHFISDNDFDISNASYKIHGITKGFIKENGKSRKNVLSLLANDLTQFRPLVVGHFIELDFHLIGADSYRAGIENPLQQYPMFCTMQATTHFIQNPAKKFLKLCDLHNYLFNSPMADHHNALADAKATALCFYELIKRGEIDDAKIIKQQKFLTEPAVKPKAKGCSFILLAVFLLLILTMTFL